LVSLIVPYRAAPNREAAWRWLERYWRTAHPEWEIVLGDGGADPWSRSEAINDAARRATGDVYVVADADTYPAGREDWAIEQALWNAGQCFPFAELVHLTHIATMQLVSNDALWVAEKPSAEAWRWASGSSLFAIRAESFWLAGGFDPRFRGWCYEDVAFSEAVGCLVEPWVRAEGVVYHLWHPAHEGWVNTSQDAANLALVERYHRARWSPEEMRALVAEHA
jgi:hypothetical protein